MRFRPLWICFAALLLSACELVGTDEGNRDGTCGQHSSCPSDQACTGSNCIDMLGRSFNITAIDVEVCNANLDGEDFDSLSGTPPDPKVELRFDGAVLFSSNAHDNTLDTTFTVQDVSATINDFSDSFVLEVRDDDAPLSELMDTLSVDIGYPGLRGGELIVRNQADCTESPVTRVAIHLQPSDGAW
jgi:hypothetical protein